MEQAANSAVTWSQQSWQHFNSGNRKDENIISSQCKRKMPLRRSDSPTRKIRKFRQNSNWRSFLETDTGRKTELPREARGDIYFGSYNQICDDGHLSDALQAVNCMNQQGIHVSTKLFFCLLQRCISDKDLGAGREVHNLIVGNGLELNTFLGCHLIHMFTAFENLSEADQVFTKLPKTSVFAWSAIISAHAKLGQNGEAIDLYQRMHSSNVEPDGHLFVAVLKACTSAGYLGSGKVIHADIVEAGVESDVFVGNTLVDMYFKCGSIQDAGIVFDRLPERDVVTWNVLITGYTQYGHCQEALRSFYGMQQVNMEPDSITYISILKACADMEALGQAKWIHAQIVGSGVEMDLAVCNTLIDLYGKCGSFEDANMVFNTLSKRDVVTWTSLIAGYAMHGHGHEAVQLFLLMQQESVQPDSVTFVGVLKACSNPETLELGKLIHAHIIECGLELDAFVGSCVIDMYCKCGNLKGANTQFNRMPGRNLVAWSSLIAGFTEQGHGEEAIQICKQMQWEGIQPDQVTVVCILGACSSILAFQQGKEMHTCSIERGFGFDIYVGNALIYMYGKCGSLEDAHLQFARLPTRDVVTWSTLIGGYAEHGCGLEALQLFQQMRQEGMEANRVTIVCILKACSSVAALAQGKQIHTLIVDNGFDSDVCVCNSLIDMYCKCGSLEDACTVFARLEQRNIVTWNALIAGYAHDNNYLSAFQYFEGMQQAGLKPNDVTFTCLLSACSHEALLDVGCLHFKSIREDHGIVPRIEHYDSLADMLGQMGYMKEAEDLLDTIPYAHNVVGWTSLLSSCRKHGNVDLGKRCFDHVVTMEGRNATAYVLMSSIYAQAGLQENVEHIESMRRIANAWKKPAKAFVEIDKIVHGFIVGDTHHPQIEEIYAKLKALTIQMREERYKPPLNFVQDTASSVQRTDTLCGHSEKLAVAFGLMCTPRGVTVRVAKNLRVCDDCHTVIKLISKIEMREIVIIDAYCIHHFKNGACSCKNHD